MERLTFDGSFCDIAQCTETPGGSFCEDGDCSQRKVWERLKQYEDTGYTPEEIAKLQATLIVCETEFRKTRKELKEFYDRDVNLERAFNSGLRAENKKLAADRKALINELCQYCGKYKQAHEGACDECKWRDM